MQGLQVDGLELVFSTSDNFQGNNAATTGYLGAVDLTPPELKTGELELWLVDLVCPFATPESTEAQACLSDLITGVLKGKSLKMHKTDPQTGEKSVTELGEK